jgi:hypothetical protein
MNNDQCCVVSLIPLDQDYMGCNTKPNPGWDLGKVSPPKELYRHIRQ